MVGASRGWEEEEAATQILWFRTPSSQPIFLVDGSNSSSLASALTVAAPEFQGRVVFDPGPVPVLRIRKVLRSDEGEYRCRSVYRRSRTQKCLIIMTVISEYTSRSSSRPPLPFTSCLSMSSSSFPGHHLLSDLLSKILTASDNQAGKGRSVRGK